MKDRNAKTSAPAGKDNLETGLQPHVEEIRERMRAADARDGAPALAEAMEEAGKAAEEKMREHARDVMDVATFEPVPAGVQACPSHHHEEEEQEKEEAQKPAPLSEKELNRLTQGIIAAIKTVFDPEIPVDVYELGLIYRIDISDDRVITIDMTLTAPGCPVAGDMPGWVQKAVMQVEGVKEVRVNLVFDPPWDMSRMSDEARLALNMW